MDAPSSLMRSQAKRVLETMELERLQREVARLRRKWIGEHDGDYCDD